MRKWVFDDIFQNLVLLITGALTLINKFLSLDRENLSAIETEGHILLNLNNYKDADKRFNNIIDKLSPINNVNDPSLFNVLYD